MKRFVLNYRGIENTHEVDAYLKKLILSSFSSRSRGEDDLFLNLREIALKQLPFKCERIVCFPHSAHARDATLVRLL